MVTLRRAFTLIEVILVMVILAISLTPLSILIVNVTQKNILSYAQAQASALAEKEMERVTQLRFSTLTCATSTPFSSPFSAFSYTVDVDYVNPSALDTSVGRPSGCSSSGGTNTNYKRVQVTVNNVITGPLTVTTLVTNDW